MADPGRQESQDTPSEEPSQAWVRPYYEAVVFYSLVAGAALLVCEAILARLDAPHQVALAVKAGVVAPLALHAGWQAPKWPASVAMFVGILSTTFYEIAMLYALAPRFAHRDIAESMRSTVLVMMASGALAAGLVAFLPRRR